MKTAVEAIISFEVMRMIRRGHCILTESKATGEIRPVNKHFRLTG
jgi:hypothetical protein